VNLAVLGAGAWGTALSIAFSKQHSVSLWCRDPAFGEALRASRRNAYLPEVLLGEAVNVTAALSRALTAVDLVVIATPTAGLRNTLEHPVLKRSAAPLLWVCKGFEQQSLLLPHQVLAALPPRGAPTGALSGPSFALEVARGQPTALVVAGSDAAFIERMARELSNDALRVYSSSDLIGVELGGALKNVIAIAAGICDGLSLGRNARAALVTRGLAEITRLGVAMGARPETFMGLAGLGDLLLTATGDLSRNRTVGMRLATGQRLTDILASLGHVAEGVRTAESAVLLARRHGVEMPITEQVHAVLQGRVQPAVAVGALLAREVKAE
jgi:glycerol-3-phosphate dehydrogenase (NAD(P)+)